MHEVFVLQVYSRSRQYKVFGKEHYYYNARIARKYAHYDIDVCRTIEFDDKEAEVQRNHGYIFSSGIDHRG